jgi:hypothetical protein
MKKLFLSLLLACTTFCLSAQTFEMKAGVINTGFSETGYPSVLCHDSENVYMYQLSGVSINFYKLEQGDFKETQKTTTEVIEGKDAENGSLIDVSVVGKKLYVIYRIYDKKGEVVKVYGAIYDKSGKKLKKELIEKYECNVIEFIFGIRVRYSPDNKRILLVYEPFSRFAYCLTHYKPNMSCDDMIKNRNQNKQTSLLLLDKDFEKIGSFDDVLEVNEEHIYSVNYLVTDSGKIFYYYSNNAEEGDERYVLRIYDLKEGEEADVTQDIFLGLGKKYDVNFIVGHQMPDENLFLTGIWRKNDEYGIYATKINGKTGDIIFTNKEKIAEDVIDKLYVENIGKGYAMGAKDLSPGRLKMMKDSSFYLYLEQVHSDCSSSPCKYFYYDAIIFKIKADGAVGGMRHMVRRQSIKGDGDHTSFIPYYAKDSIHLLYYEDLGNYKEANIAKGKTIALKKITKGAFSSYAITKSSKFKGGNKQIIALPKELQGFKIVNNYLHVLPDKSFIMVARKGKTYRIMRFVYKG